MLPFERLRALARSGIDDHELVTEAADCFADFSSDPTQLVTVCRRLLAHHPACGPLWWLCAHVVAGADPGDAARAAVRRFDSDRTPTRLASLLPFPHDDPIAVLGWPEVTARALEERPDLDVVAVRSNSRSSSTAARLRRAARTVRIVDETEATAISPSHLLVEAAAASPTIALVPEGVADLLWSLGNVTVWLVLGTGRLLPPRLFEVLLAEVERQELDYEQLEVSRAAQVAGPAGLDPPERVATRIDCPVVPELLRL